MENITLEELQAVRELTEKQKTAKLEAEKYVLISKLAEQDYNNLVLRIYLKYNLEPGVDTITSDGKIVKATNVQGENLNNIE
jgi:hypothetical protein